ncbi:MAG: hypothetical protein ABIR47_07380 [Candidatus Kapaibacterium sp.]
MNNQDLTDEDREEILRLILSEADGIDVRGELGKYPQPSRNLFRRVVREGGLVTSGDLSNDSSGESQFVAPVKLTPRGRRRLQELNTPREGTE